MIWSNRVKIVFSYDSDKSELKIEEVVANKTISDVESLYNLYSKRNWADWSFDKNTTTTQKGGSFPSEVDFDHDLFLARLHARHFRSTYVICEFTYVVEDDGAEARVVTSW